MTDRLDVATRKGLFTIERRNGAWAVADTAFLGDNCSMVLRDPRSPATVYCALDHGHFGVKLHRTDDDGRTWSEIGVPAYPPMPEGYEPKRRPEAGEPVPWDLKLVWTLEAGGTDEPDAIWAGTGPGGLFRSDDRGASWALNRPLWDEPGREAWFGGGYDYPAIHSICVDPRDAAHVTVGVSCGGVWVTRDRGTTWTVQAKGMRAEYMPPERAEDQEIQDPHRVVQCPAAPDCMWAQHHNGVYRTTDGARTWQSIPDVPPSVFGFAVAVHPGDPDTAWLVPAVKDEHRVPAGGQVVVTRTRDGGRTFDVLRNGLPQEHAYDLTFRHGLDVDKTGDRLAFGSSTGSLWVSEDQGDSFTCVSNHLPPVHAVRFSPVVP